MDKRQPQRADNRTVAISIVGIVILVICFVVILTQDNPTTRAIAIATTIVLWIFLRISRRSRGGQS